MFGTQLISIINTITEYLPAHVWYGADVDAVGSDVRKIDLSGFHLKVIGSDAQFIDYCFGVGQFIWGGFCVRSKQFCLSKYG